MLGSAAGTGAAAVTSLLTGRNWAPVPSLSRARESRESASPLTEASVPVVAIGALRRHLRLSQSEPGTAAEQRSGMSPGVPPVMSPSPRGSPSGTAIGPAGVRLGSGLSSARFSPTEATLTVPVPGEGQESVPKAGAGSLLPPAPGTLTGSARFHHLAAAATVRTKWWRGENAANHRDWAEMKRGEGGEATWAAGTRSLCSPPAPAAVPQPGRAGPAQRLGPGKASRWVLCKAGG